MENRRNIPTYDELPLNEVFKMRHAWGVFGDHDELGTLNLLTEDSRIHAAREVRQGEYFNLSLPLNLPDPSFFRSGGYKHHIYSMDRNNLDDYLDNFYLQSSSQWDALRHVSARENGFYNGFTYEEAGPNGNKLGIQNYVEHGLVGRGLLVDVPRYMERNGIEYNPLQQMPITKEMLVDILNDQGCQPNSGDILLIRTGFVHAYLKMTYQERLDFNERKECAGLSGKEDTARYLWNQQYSAVCADNPAVERIPGTREDGSLHRRLIPMLGFALGELFNLEGLAESCAKDNRYTCFFAGVPLNLPNGVGSPANAIALK